MNKFRNYSLRPNKLSCTYLTYDIPTDNYLSQLDYTTKYSELLDCMDKIVYFIDNNGGFTVTIWYNIVNINDRVLVEPNSYGGGFEFSGNNNQDNQVTARDVNHHII